MTDGRPTRRKFAPLQPQLSPLAHVKTFIALLTAVPALSLGAQQALVGYTPAGAARERDLEASAIKRPSPTTAAAHSKAAVARDARRRHAGAGAHARLRDRADEDVGTRDGGSRATTSGCRTRRRCSVSRVSPQPKDVRARRAAGGGRSDVDARAVSDGQRLQRRRATSTAEVVYVNYGLIEDYAQLDSMGVSVKGKIAIARYGRSFRGIKAREAEKHGAVGAADLQRSAGRRLRRGRRVSRRTDAKQQRRSARQHPQPGRRSVDAGIRKHRAAFRASRPTRWRSRTFRSCRSATATPSELLKYVTGPGRAAGLAGRTCRSTITSARVRCARASP